MTRTSLLRLLVLGLVLASHGVHAQDDEDYPDDDYDGGGGMDDYGGGEGEDEPPPPPPPGNVEDLSTVEEFEAFVDNLDASVVGAFLETEIKDPEAVVPEGWDAEEDGEWQAPTIQNPALTAYLEIAGSAYGYRFAKTTSPEVLAKLKSKKGGLYLFKSPQLLSPDLGDKPRERFGSDKWTDNAVSNWLAAKSQPSIGYYASSTKARFTSPTLVVFLQLDTAANPKGFGYALKRARKAAAELKGKVRLAVADLDSYELGDFGLKSKSKGDYLIGLVAGDDKYGAAEGTGFSAAALTAFANEYLKGGLTPYVKPEPDYGSSDSEDMPDSEGSDDEDGEDKDEP